MPCHKPRFFDLSGLEAIQTNVCIGRWEWCRYNAPPREKGGFANIPFDVNVKAIRMRDQTSILEKKLLSLE
jgi:hypothetical protein